MISLEKRFLFVHIPKTGGNSIRLALKDFAIDEIVFNPKQRAYNQSKQEIHRFGIKNPYISLNKHSKITDIHARWNSEHLGNWEDYFKFSCVRNPWDRLVSFYFSPHLGNTTFNKKQFIEIIQDVERGSQLSYLSEGEQLAVDFLIRFESLTEDFAQVCDRLDIHAELPKVNQSDHRPYREYYDDETQALVAKLYQADIQQFGYSF